MPLSSTVWNVLWRTIYYMLTTVSRPSFLAISYDWNEPIMVKYIIWPYLHFFTIIYPYLAILAISAIICVIIYPYSTKFTLIWPYLPLFWQHLPMITTKGHIYPCWSYLPLLCPWTHIMCSYIEALCQIVEQSDNYFWGYCIFKNGDTRSVV